MFSTLRSTTSLLLLLRSSPPTAIRSSPHAAPLKSRASMMKMMMSSSLGWKGRHPDEHAVNRTDEKDVQSQPSQAGMREKERHESNSADVGKEDSNSQGISERDQANSNKRAKEEISPKAPGPVIGMNDERGNKGH